MLCSLLGFLFHCDNYEKQETYCNFPTSSNDGKWFVISQDQEGIVNGYDLAFLPGLYSHEGLTHQKNTFFLLSFSHLLEIEA